MVFDGDSLTTASSGDYPSQLIASLPGTVVQVGVGKTFNVAVGGQTIATMLTNAASNVDSKFEAGKYNYVFILGGTNDVAAGDNATTVYNRIVSYCTARRSAGFRVVVSTLTHKGNPAQNTIIDSINTSIRANWATFADALADLDADSRLQNPADTTYFQADQLHYNTSGAAVVASIAKAALKGLAETLP